MVSVVSVVSMVPCHKCKILICKKATCRVWVWYGVSVCSWRHVSTASDVTPHGVYGADANNVLLHTYCGLHLLLPAAPLASAELQPLAQL